MDLFDTERVKILEGYHTLLKINLILQVEEKNSLSAFKLNGHYLEHGGRLKGEQVSEK